MKGFRLPTTSKAAARQQAELARKVIARDDFSDIEFVCGVDVSYRHGMAHCAAVVVNRKLEIVEYASTTGAIRHPYISGLFFLREAGPVLCTVRKLKHYDVLMVDGHGVLHPRRCGLACYLGLVLDKPAIGVAKSLLCGVVKDSRVELDGEVLGAVIGEKKKLYASVGHRISLASAVVLVKSMTKKGEWLSEPLRLADIYSRL